MSRIVDMAPKFTAITIQGEINFPTDYAGDDVIISPSGSSGVAEQRMTSTDELDCIDWFFCTKKLDKNKVLNTLLKN